MATVSTIKDEMHVASCSELLTLKSEADQMVSDYPELFGWMLHHVYKEYNKKRFFECGGANMISPYDGGFIPVDYTPFPSASALFLENNDYILLEDGDFILLE